MGKTQRTLFLRGKMVIAEMLLFPALSLFFLSLSKPCIRVFLAWVLLLFLGFLGATIGRGLGCGMCWSTLLFSFSMMGLFPCLSFSTVPSAFLLLVFACWFRLFSVCSFSGRSVLFMSPSRAFLFCCCASVVWVLLSLSKF